MRVTSDEVKKVYACFGLAYYHAEVLHRGLCNLYVLSRIPDKGGTTRPRIAEHLTDAYSATLGRIVSLVLPLLPDGLVTQLQLAIDQRNFLAHHFWFERIHLTSTSEGVRELLEELGQYSRVFQQLDVEVEKHSEPFHERAGITQDTIREALEATLRAEDSWPVLTQRRPQKEEVVVSAYEVPLEADGSTLILQTQDGVLWQLCDAGLGWTAYDQVGAEWRPAKAIDQLLPAHINPRPRVEAPWQYEIFLGQGASLVVQPGIERNNYRWGVRRKAPTTTRSS